jgi:cysteine desulfurase
MHANNETGVVQPVAEVGALARELGLLFHIDGVQAAGKLPVDVRSLQCDYYSLSAHKLYAPKGVGALYVRPGAPVRAQLLGGHHERDRRAGTENVAGVVAFGAAARLLRSLDDTARIAGLRDRLERGILEAIPDTWVNGAGAERLPNTTNIGFSGVEGEAMVIALDLRGFAVSSGSACSSGAVEPSHVLLAMGLSREDARSCLRFSLGRGNTVEQVDNLVEAVAASATQLRRVSATYSHA